MKKLAGSKKSSTFASAKNKAAHFGVLVQLVRMPACHAGGHGFEPRTHRIKRSFLFKGKLLFLCCTLLHVVDY